MTCQKSHGSVIQWIERNRLVNCSCEECYPHRVRNIHPYTLYILLLADWLSSYTMNPFVLRSSLAIKKRICGSDRTEWTKYFNLNTSCWDLVTSRENIYIKLLVQFTPYYFLTLTSTLQSWFSDTSVNMNLEPGVVYETDCHTTTAKTKAKSPLCHLRWAGHQESLQSSYRQPRIDHVRLQGAHWPHCLLLSHTAKYQLNNPDDCSST